MQSKHTEPETTDPTAGERIREVDAPRDEEGGSTGAARNRHSAKRPDPRASVPSRVEEVAEYGEPGGGPKVENV